jgi:hypothetical protein
MRHGSFRGANDAASLPGGDKVFQLTLGNATEHAGSPEIADAIMSRQSF